MKIYAEKQNIENINKILSNNDIDFDIESIDDHDDEIIEILKDEYSKKILNGVDNILDKIDRTQRIEEYSLLLELKESLHIILDKKLKNYNEYLYTNRHSLMLLPINSFSDKIYEYVQSMDKQSFKKWLKEKKQIELDNNSIKNSINLIKDV